MASTPTIKMLVNGRFVESETSHFEDVTNPATQEVLARVPFSTGAEIEAAVAAATQAFHTWKNTPISSRARIFFKLQDIHMFFPHFQEPAYILFSNHMPLTKTRPLIFTRYDFCQIVSYRHSYSFFSIYFSYHESSPV